MRNGVTKVAIPCCGFSTDGVCISGQAFAYIERVIYQGGFKCLYDKKIRNVRSLIYMRIYSILQFSMITCLNGSLTSILIIKADIRKSIGHIHRSKNPKNSVTHVTGGAGFRQSNISSYVALLTSTCISQFVFLNLCFFRLHLHFCHFLMSFVL